MPSDPSLRELVEYLTRSLVDVPEDVEVTEIPEGNTLVYEMRVAPGDVGKVIGKQGRTIKAMRTVLYAGSSKLRKRAELEIIE